ncbi:MAG: hypothetical protein QNJ16_07135 [Rhodobacter sp.]|nr:hypothetical protein [Rhodobacter sp.]
MSLLIWVGSSVAYWLWLGPFLIEHRVEAFRYFYPKGTLIPAVMVLPSLAFGLMIAIYTLSPLPNRVLFRPTRARLITTLVLWLIYPVGSVGLWPFSAGFVVSNGLANALNGMDFSRDWQLRFALLLLPMAVTYAATCLFGSALPNWKLRFFAVNLYWWAAFSVMIAHGGILLDFGPV